MKDTLTHYANETLNSAKIAHTTAVTTAGTGMATWLDWIPSDIGKLATLIGICLSLVLLATHTRNFFVNRKRDKEEDKRRAERHEKEMALLDKKISEL